MVRIVQGSIVMENPKQRFRRTPTIHICVDLGHARDGLGALRALLVGDLLRRTAEYLQRRNAALLMINSRSAPGTEPSGSWLITRLQIREPLLRTGSVDDAIAFCGGSLDALVVPDLPNITPPPVASRLLRTGPVNSSTAAELPKIISELLEEDPLALRLALLRFAYEEPAQISRARAHRAVETLERWRFKMAGWHDMPPTTPSDLLPTMHQALLTDLDVPRVLTLLHRIEADPRQPSGRKLAAFTDIDRILGLDLGYLIGKGRG